MRPSLFHLRCGAGMRLAVRAVLLALALSAAGCASTHNQRYDAAAMRAAAQAAAVPAAEIEDDGMPAQTPPRHGSPQEADDPREPYSPNYGGGQQPQRVGQATRSSDPAGPAAASWSGQVAAHQSR